MKTDSKSKVVVAIAILTILVGSNVVAGQQSDEAAVALQRAIRAELVDGDLTAAIGMYEEIVSRYAAERAVVAQALLRLGDSYEKLGDAQALVAYGRVLSDYSDQPDAVAEARSRLASLQSGDEADRSPGILTRQVWSRGSFTGNVAVASPSPDGRYVAFLKYPDLAVYDTETGRERLLTKVPTWVDDGYVENMAWSRDGARIAYSLWTDNFAHAELHVLRADGSDDHILVVTDESALVMPMAWSRDGDFIVALLTGPDAYRIGTVSTTDGTVEILKTLGTHNLFPLSLSPDDKYIVYDYPQGDDVDTHDVFILATDGSSEERLVSHAADDDRPFWTPDGGRVVFLSDRSGRRSLYAVEVRDGRPAGDPELVRHDVGPIVTQGFSRSGALYYTLNINFTDVHVAELDLNGTGTLSEPSPLTERFEGTNSLPSWSPDGRRVAFFSRRGPGQGNYAVVKSMDTGEEQDFAVPSGGGPNGGSPEWSADGRHLRIGGRVRLDLETGEVATEAFSRDEVVRGAGLRYFATAAQEEALRAANIRILRRAQARRLLAGGDLPLRPGEELMWVGNGGASRVLPGGEVEEIGPRGHVHAWALSPDGTQVAWAVSSDTILSSNRLLIMPVKGGEIRELTQLPRTSEAGDKVYEIRRVQWTPDSQRLLYEVDTDREPELWQVPAAGGAPKRLDLPLEAMRVRFHPNGRSVVFWTETIAKEIWLMEGFPWQQ